MTPVGRGGDDSDEEDEERDRWRDWRERSVSTLPDRKPSITPSSSSHRSTTTTTLYGQRGEAGQGEEEVRDGQEGLMMFSQAMQQAGGRKGDRMTVGEGEEDEEGGGDEDDEGGDD
jgi:hypothetical protein